jgi:hypothetical protein
VPDFDEAASVVDVDDTTMFVSPSEPISAEAGSEPAAADAAIEELDFGPIDDTVVDELAIALS